MDFTTGIAIGLVGGLIIGSWVTWKWAAKELVRDHYKYLKE
jgi:uncharacterized protein YneF (UPF0154 family)